MPVMTVPNALALVLPRRARLAASSEGAMTNRQIKDIVPKRWAAATVTSDTC